MDARLLKFLDNPIAHRGLHDEQQGIVENSLPAFERAISQGLPIECDLRLTLDGEVVIFHDPNLMRLCQSDLVVEESSLSELHSFHLLHTDQKIPTLEELLDLAPAEHPLLLELKVPKFNGALEARVREIIRGREEQVAIQSFHPVSLWWWTKNAPAFLRGLVSGDLRTIDLPRWQRLLIEHLIMGPLVRPHFVSYQGELLSRAVLSLIDLPIFAWTARSQGQGERFMINGAANIIFEGYNPREKGPNCP